MSGGPETPSPETEPSNDVFPDGPEAADESDAGAPEQEPAFNPDEEAADRAEENPEDILEREEEGEAAPGEAPATPETTEAPKPKTRFESTMDSLGKGLAAMAEKLGPALKKLGEMMEVFMKAMSKAFAPLVPTLVKMGIKPPEWMMDKTRGMKEVTDAVINNNRTLEPSANDTAILRELVQIHADTEAEFTKKGRGYSMDQMIVEAVRGIDPAKEKITFADIKTKVLEISEDKKEEARALPAAPAAAPVPPAAPPVNPAPAENPAPAPETPVPPAA